MTDPTPTTDSDGIQRVDGQVAADHVPDGVYVLPERAALDPVSAGALALMEILPPMLDGSGEDAMAVDMKVLAAAVLDAVTDMPRLPPWEGQRSIGGASRPPGSPDPEITVDVNGHLVELCIEADAPEGGPLTYYVLIPPADARPWFLAGLAACVAAETPAHPQPQE